MPYKVVKQKGKWKVVNSQTGKVYGTHTNKPSADAQLKALYANTKENVK